MGPVRVSRHVNAAAYLLRRCDDTMVRVPGFSNRAERPLHQLPGDNLRVPIQRGHRHCHGTGPSVTRHGVVDRCGRPDPRPPRRSRQRTRPRRAGTRRGPCAGAAWCRTPSPAATPSPSPDPQHRWSQCERRRLSQPSAGLGRVHPIFGQVQRVDAPPEQLVSRWPAVLCGPRRFFGLCVFFTG